MKDILMMDILSLHNKIAKKEISCIEITKAYLENIKVKDKDVQAYITVTEEEAFKRASKLDDELFDEKDLPLLYGIPGGIKDNICTKDIRTTCASKMLSNFVPSYSATAYKKLYESGMFCSKA